MDLLSATRFFMRTQKTVESESLQAYAERLMEFGKQLEGEMRPYLDRTAKMEHE